MHSTLPTISCCKSLKIHQLTVYRNLKEVIGFLLNKIDMNELDEDFLVGQVSSLVESPFYLSRYRFLKVSDFSDEITTINPNELLMGGGGGGGPAGDFDFIAPNN